MAKSRFRYWLGMGVLFGMLTSFFRMSARQNPSPADQQTYHNGFHNPLALLPSEQKFRLGQLDDANKLAASANTADHATPELANSIFWISAEEAWQALGTGDAILLDLRSYDDYQEQHPKGARSFSAARILDLEAAVPDKNQNCILLHWPNLKIGEIAGEFIRRGYRHLYALDMHSWRAGPYKMSEWEQANLPVEYGMAFQLDSVTIKLGNDEILRTLSAA
jgi:rhodanese-related sulfurtransferase